MEIWPKCLKIVKNLERVPEGLPLDKRLDFWRISGEKIVAKFRRKNFVGFAGQNGCILLELLPTSPPSLDNLLIFQLATLLKYPSQS